MSTTRTLTTTLPADTLYVSGTVNGTATTWTNTEGQIWESIVERSESDIYNVELTVINGIGTSSEYSFTLYYGLHLVTDRTAADVYRVSDLKNKLLSGAATDEEIAEWNAGLRGAYNATDMNRVEAAVEFLQDYLNGMQEALDAYRASLSVADDSYWLVPYSAFDLITKTDWTTSGFPTDADLARYLSNVDALTSAIRIAKSLPQSMSLLDFTGANEIERSLLAEYDAAQKYEADTKKLIDNTAAAFIYSGEIYGGEV